MRIRLCVIGIMLAALTASCAEKHAAAPPAASQPSAHSFLFELQPLQDNTDAAQLLDTTATLIQHRLSAASFTDLNVRKIAPNRIQIDIPDSQTQNNAAILRIVTVPGTLEFRITAAAPANIGGISNDDEKNARQNLESMGASHRVTLDGAKALWIPIDPNSKGNFTLGFITAQKSGESYLLCYDDLAHSLTHQPPRKRWNVIAGKPIASAEGFLLPIGLDPAGAGYLGELTAANLNRPLAIIVDGNVLSAPTIRARITNAAQISFGYGRPLEDTRKQAEYLYLMLDNALPARVTLVPSPSPRSAP